MKNEQRDIFNRGVRIVISYVRAHPLPFIVAVSGAAVFAGATVASAIALGWVADSVIVPAIDEGGLGTSTVVWGVVVVMAIAVLRAAGVVTRRYFAGMTAARVQRSLRTRVVDRYREFPVAYYRAKPTGELLAHAEADVDAATDVLHPLPFSTAVVMLIVIAVVALVATDLFLAAIGLTVLPILTWLSRLFGRLVEPPATRAQQKVGDVSAVGHESLDGALVVKTLGREADEVARFGREVEELRERRVEMGVLRANFDPAFNALPNLGIVVLLAVGAWRVSTGDVTTGTLVQFVALFQLLAFPMRVIGWVLFEVPRTVVGYERLQTVFDEPARLVLDGDAGRLPDGPLGLSVRSLSFGYDGSNTLSGVDFEIMPNESVALVGSTGAGKSTLAELLVRLADPDDGAIRLGGVDLRSVPPGDLRRVATVVFQESFLFASTVRDNIALDLDVPGEEIVAAARVARAHDFIQRLPNGYETVVGERGVTVSGGQRQRIALARAILRKPRLLVLDDATSSVDPTVEAEILDGLRSNLDATLLVIAYRVSTIRLADSVLWLQEGRVADQGSHEQLLQNPAYEAMVRAYERDRV